MTTRKELIIEKYSILKEQIIRYTDQESFFGLSDDINDDSIADLVFYTTMLFVGIDTNIQYENKIQELFELNQVNIARENELKVIEIIREFVQWLKLL